MGLFSLSIYLSCLFYDKIIKVPINHLQPVFPLLTTVVFKHIPHWQTYAIMGVNNQILCSLVNQYLYICYY